ncbi:hypothetical protein MES5069_1010004 [Mesorhizobium escarrei]|uniref:Uncharacterized protein n=1 Tax=Mesorhizobium escarrei TaxID=666018 RepID=A0ABN8JDK3_9HYPH|nr:hypothetical protein MES5069_1010004 [Mesorhizobium escarrei]
MLLKHGPQKTGAAKALFCRFERGRAGKGGGSCGQGHTGAAVGPWWEEQDLRAVLTLTLPGLLLVLCRRISA